MNHESVLSDSTLVIVFTTVPTGLGHLRVTDALYHGLPPTVTPVLLGAQDHQISNFYRLVSINAVTRYAMEWIQNSTAEQSASLIRRYFRLHTKALLHQMITILGERLTVPKTVLVVATHPIQADQLAAIKPKIEQQTGVRIILVVQVTDDSPQPSWYIPEADMLFVPSEYTKDQLLLYAKKSNLPIVPITVIAYPISPSFAHELSETSFEQRTKQVDPASHTTIHMSIPVSGAAVGTTYLKELIPLLHHASERFAFHVVSKDASFTKAFLAHMNTLSYPHLLAAHHDRDTVKNYETLFEQTLISLEITKPSEQTFKALATPKQRGGILLLFSKPVGRQEYDNLHFLRIRGLMPSKTDNEHLWILAYNQEPVPHELLLLAHHWRAIRLPDDAPTAVNFITWCLQQRIFAHMMTYNLHEQGHEVSPHGVEQFWGVVEKLLKKSGS